MYDDAANEFHSDIYTPPRWMWWALVLGVFLVRTAYLIWLSPYELVGDEAYYWAQSQHLGLSYQEKGPLLAWIIAICCKIFGSVEWAVRLPVALASLMAALIVGHLTLSFTHGDRRSTWFAAIIFLLIPAFQANAQICTQDGPLIVLLIGLTAIGLRLVRRWELDQNTWAEWLGVWGCFGIGILLKQSILLFGTAFVGYAIFRFHKLCFRPVLVVQQLAGLALLLVISSPVLLWEHQHGWPMLRHTLGHLGLGADHATRVNRTDHLAWFGNVVGGLVGAGGPAFIFLSCWASWDSIRSRKSEPSRWPDQLWLLCAAWPSILFFLALSLEKAVVPSWPLPSLVPLVILVAEFTSRNLPAFKWRRHPINGTEIKRPPASLRSRMCVLCWKTLVIYGFGGAVLIMFPNLLAYLPVIGAKIDRSLLSRIHGTWSEAQTLDQVAMTIATADGKRPIVIAPNYMKASLYSFYMPDHELTVTTPGGYIGTRPNNFDIWDSTRLDNIAFHGRSLLLVQGNSEQWFKRFKVDSIRRVDSRRNLFIGDNFQGLRVLEEETP